MTNKKHCLIAYILQAICHLQMFIKLKKKNKEIFVTFGTISATELLRNSMLRVKVANVV